MKSKTKNIIIIVVSIILVAGLGSIFVNMGITWFNSLTKPSKWVPNFIIPIIWSIIYITFVSVLIKWQNESIISTKTIALLAINGLLNVLWCLVFFALNQTLIGNIVILLNLIAGFILVSDIYSQKRLYGTALLIYPIWLSIATTLNMATWILN